MKQPSQQESDRRSAQSGRDRILRDSEVRERTGLSRTTRWRLIRKGTFPQPVLITERAIGWRETDIQLWIDEREPKAALADRDREARR
jgi:prophage regulatory protein